MTNRLPAATLPLERKRPPCPSCGNPLSQLVEPDYRRCLTAGCPVTATYAP
jgi:hypothetical protein